MRIGPKYGYFPNPAKCVLIVKDTKSEKEAEELFGKYNMEFTTGNRNLGAVLGSTQSKVEFVTKKVDQWVDDVKQLANIAISGPKQLTLEIVVEFNTAGPSYLKMCFT